ncbi:hypothetical protein HYV43_03335 [Candidatus Micrarchaeota archaeon]|nr:hypothetical protein [Candidatus Micrarchaeota archaeon]
MRKEEPEPFHAQTRALAGLVETHLARRYRENMTWAQLHAQLARHENAQLKQRYGDFLETVKHADRTRFKDRTDPYHYQKNALAYLLGMKESSFEIDNQGKVCRKTIRAAKK